MKSNNIYKFFALLLLACLGLGCNKQPEESAGKAGAAAATKDQAVAELSAQQQPKPTADQFKVSPEGMKERGSVAEIPASWPAELSLPDGATVTQAASREGTDVVQFSVPAGLVEVSAHMSADASIAGYTLRQAEVDKFTQKRSYTSDSREYVTTITQVDDECFGTLILSPLNPAAYYAESTHYLGEFSLPNGWPSDILPVYPECVLRELYVPLKPGGRLMLSAQSTDEEQDVINWLETELANHGWTLTDSQSRNGFSIRMMEGNGYSLSVAARGTDGITDIQYEANTLQS